MSLGPRNAKAKSIVDAGRLSGPEKAAVILLSLGEDHDAIWRALDEDEIKDISQAMAGLGNVSAQVVEELMVEFVSGMSGAGSIMGSFEQTQKLLAGFMASDKVDTLMEEIRGPAGRTMWDKLGNVNEAVLANYADRRGDPLQDQVRARRAGAVGAAGGLRARVRDAHAAHGACAARDPRQDRADVAHRVHVEPRAHFQAR